MMFPRFSPDYHWQDLFDCFLLTPNSTISRFEEEMAYRAGHNYGISFRYGRSGLFYLLKALGAKNKKVILPSYTCVVVAHAIVCSGNIPIFLDNASTSFQPGPKDYLEVIDSDTVMVIPTHLFGFSQEVEELYMEIKKKHPHIFVLQDCAHSFFCRDIKGIEVTRWGDGALFGLNISKLVNTVKGGALTLKDKELGLQVRSHIPPQKSSFSESFYARLYVIAAAFGFSPLFYKNLYWLINHTSLFKSQIEYYKPDQIALPQDFAKPMSSFESKIGVRSLRRLEERVARRKEISAIYLQGLLALEKKGKLKLPPSHEGYTWSHFPILVAPEIRTTFLTWLRENSIFEPGVIVDYAISEFPVYINRGYMPCPQAASVVNQIINLPLTLGEGLFFPRDYLRTAKNIVKDIYLFFNENF